MIKNFIIFINNLQKKILVKVSIKNILKENFLKIAKNIIRKL